VASPIPFPFSRYRLALGAGRSNASAMQEKMKMDMRKFSGEHFIKVDDVRNGPIQGQIAVVRQGKYDKPDLVFESGDVLSLNTTNTQTLIRAFGADSEYWTAKQIEMFLGEIQYQGSDHEAVLVRPISPPTRPAAETKADFDDEIPY
jgi:hypothetical protein